MVAPCTSVTPRSMLPPRCADSGETKVSAVTLRHFDAEHLGLVVSVVPKWSTSRFLLSTRVSRCRPLWPRSASRGWRGDRGRPRTVGRAPLWTRQQLARVLEAAYKRARSFERALVTLRAIRGLTTDPASGWLLRRVFWANNLAPESPRPQEHSTNYLIESTGLSRITRPVLGSHTNTSDSRYACFPPARSKTVPSAVKPKAFARVGSPNRSLSCERK